MNISHNDSYEPHFNHFRLLMTSETESTRMTQRMTMHRGYVKSTKDYPDPSNSL